MAPATSPEPTIRMRYEGEEPRRVRHGYRLYELQPGAEFDVNNVDKQLLLDHGAVLVTDTSTLEALNAKDLVAAIKAGDINVDEAEAFEAGREGGPRTTVTDAITATRTAAAAGAGGEQS